MITSPSTITAIIKGIFKRDSTPLHSPSTAAASSDCRDNRAYILISPSQPAANTASSSKIFDRYEFVRRNLDDLELSRDVAALFVQHGPEYLRDIRAAVSAGDSDALRQAAHKLKGAAANLALPSLRDAAASLEAIAGTGNVSRAAGQVSELKNTYDQAVCELEDWGNTARSGVSLP